MIRVKGPWWKEYRQQQYKIRRTMNMEMIIRKSFGKVLREYIDNSSIGGISQMCDPKKGWKQRLFRTWVFCFTFSVVCYFLYYVWFDTLAKTLIVTSESSTYPISQIDFPAVALCNVNRISKKALKRYAKNTHHLFAVRNETVEEVEEFCLQSGRLLDFSYDEKWNSHAFLDVINANRYDTKLIINAMKMLAPSCSEMLLKCAWGGELVNCSSLFTVRRTARGHCCTFNYILDYESATSPKRTIGEVKRQLLPGNARGLTVLLNPMLDDYAYPLNNFNGFDVILFDPTHYADLSAGRVTHRLAEPNQVEFIELKSLRQIASPEVRKYPLSSRKCLFRDEADIEFHNMYSYSACIVRCRMKSVQSLCKCTPFFLPVGEDEGRVCTLDDLKCLNKYKEKLMYLYPIDAVKTDGLEIELEDSIYCPDCLPDCELTQHFTKSYKISLTNLEERHYYINGFVRGINMTNKCLINIYHSASDAILDRLDVVSYWFEILSNIGGFAGVLIGFSVLSTIEIVYFLIVRFVLILRNNYRKYH